MWKAVTKKYINRLLLSNFYVLKWSKSIILREINLHLSLKWCSGNLGHSLASFGLQGQKVLCFYARARGSEALVVLLATVTILVAMLEHHEVWQLEIESQHMTTELSL